MEGSSSLDVYRALRSASHYIKKDLRNKLVNHGITWPQFHALYHIGEEDGIAINELAKELKCNASNMTGLIDRMVENNWVYRKQCEHDRRIWLIKLTQEGAELRDKLIPIHHDNIKKRMEILSDEELTTLKAILDKLIKGEVR